MHKYIEVSSEESIVGKNGNYQIELDRKNLLNEKGLYREFYKYFNEYSFFQRQEEAFGFETPKIKGKKFKKAIMTDIMGYGPWIMAFPWLISEEMYKVMAQFNLGKHKLFEVNIEDSEEKYYLLHKKNILKEFYKYEDCVVSTGHYDTYKEHTFNNYQDYLLFDEQNILSEFRTVALDKIYEQEDLIFTQTAGNYFSDQLIKAIEEKGLTGLRINDNYCKIIFV